MSNIFYGGGVCKEIYITLSTRKKELSNNSIVSDLRDRSCSLGGSVDTSGYGFGIVRQSSSFQSFFFRVFLYIYTVKELL